MKELKLRLDDDEYERFADAAYARGRMKHQRALKEALEAWIAAGATAKGDGPILAAVETDPPHNRNSSKEGGDSGSTTSGSTVIVGMGVEVPVQGGNLSDAEQAAVRLLLVILRSGSETVKRAITWNLHGFAEPITAEKRPQKHGMSADSDFSKTFDDIIRSFEAISADEKARGRWVADLRRIQKEFAEVPGKSGNARGPRRKRTG